MAKRAISVSTITIGSKSYIITGLFFVAEGIKKVGLANDIAFHLIFFSSVDNKILWVFFAPRKKCGDVLRDGS